MDQETGEENPKQTNTLVSMGAAVTLALLVGLLAFPNVKTTHTIDMKPPVQTEDMPVFSMSKNGEVIVHDPKASNTKTWNEFTKQ